MGSMGYDLSTEAAHEKSLLKNDKTAVGAVPVGTRPSMLQDALNHRRMEVDAILGEVQEFAHHHHVPIPAIDVVLSLLEGLDQSIAINQRPA